MCWDADGAMYVAEMRDYPVGPRSGTIRRLVDRDGDGRYETATIFADKLNFPNGLLAYRRGCWSPRAPDMLFFRDSRRRRRGRPAASRLHRLRRGEPAIARQWTTWGLDNWIYGANGRSDGAIRRPDEPPGAAFRSARAIFASRADFSASSPYSAKANSARRTTTGAIASCRGTRSPSGRRSSTRPTSLEIRTWRGYAVVQPGRPQRHGRGISHRARPADVQSRIDESLQRAGRPDDLPRRQSWTASMPATRSWENRCRAWCIVASSCPRGQRSSRGACEQGREFLAGADPWFHPVFTMRPGPTAPCTSPIFIAAGSNIRSSWPAMARQGRVAGRIRSRPHLARAPSRRFPPRQPKLTTASTADLVAHLADPNGWSRDTAQRLIVERADKSAIPLLAEQTRQADPILAATALWTLAGLNGLDDRLLLSALASPTASVRIQALQIAAKPLARSAALRPACLAHGERLLIREFAFSWHEHRWHAWS